MGASTAYPLSHVGTFRMLWSLWLAVSAPFSVVGVVFSMLLVTVFVVAFELNLVGWH